MMAYCPSRPVAAPCVVPSMRTLTPGSASPVTASVTVPAILPVWAHAEGAKPAATQASRRRPRRRGVRMAVVRGSGGGRRAVAVPLQERGADALEVGAHPLGGERRIAGEERVEDADVLGVVARARAEDVDEGALLVLEQPRQDVGDLVEDGVAGGRGDGRVEGHVGGVEDVVVREVRLG